MKNLSIYLLFIFAIVAAYGFAYANTPDELSGKKVFLDKKCDMCHTVVSENITSKKKDATDLSETGKELNTDFLSKYLNKKEKLNDKEHKTAFKGTDEELKVLSEWLESLKGSEEK
jgi:CxxC motif-containing protein (DUF1111 family)